MTPFLPRIAVLLPAYNAEGHIMRAVESILSQTYPHFDLWVINDGSTDGTGDALSRFQDKRIKLVNNEKNLGLIATLNRGLDLICAHGGYTYIARMDADDMALPERFGKQVAFLQASPDLVLCSTAMDLKGNKSGRLVYPTSPLAVRYAALGMVSKAGHPSVMARASLFKSGEIRYESNYTHAEDVKLWATITKKFNISNINEPLCLYYFHGMNISLLKKEQQRRCADRVNEEEFESFLGRPLAEDERPFVVHRIPPSRFDAYLAFYKNVLARIVKRDKAFLEDKECQRLVARLVARTLFMNWRQLKVRQAVTLIRTLLMDKMRLRSGKALWLVARSMAVTKVAGLHNAL